MGDHRFNKQATDLERRLASGHTVQAKDRLGRDLQPGDLVLLNQPAQATSHLLWQVRQITPSLNPADPQPLIQIQVVATFNLLAPRGGQPIQELLRVVEAATEAAQQPPIPEPDTPAPDGAVVES